MKKETSQSFLLSAFVNVITTLLSCQYNIAAYIKAIWLDVTVYTHAPIFLYIIQSIELPFVYPIYFLLGGEQLAVLA